MWYFQYLSQVPLVKCLYYNFIYCEFQHNRAKKGHCEVFTVNPKCVKLGELYGETDPNTYDWSDGLIAMAVRKFSKELSKHSSGDDRPSTSGSVMTDHTRVGEAEPQHDKTNKMACVPSEDSYQPGHSPKLIRVFAVRLKKAWVLSYPLSAQ